MDTNEALIGRFYRAFGEADHITMAACYSDRATFGDPVFPQLDAEGVRAMWRMFCTSGNKIEVSHNDVKADETTGSARWEAVYTFPKTKRRVHNVVSASFRFEDELIVRHEDSFDFYRWSRMALGAPGVLLGWSPVVKNQVRKQAAAQLRRFRAQED